MYILKNLLILALCKDTRMNLQKTVSHFKENIIWPGSQNGIHYSILLFCLYFTCQCSGHHARLVCKTLQNLDTG
uniref:Uncharacterized protein n=1 Tax=Pararge aegeria TaxID=116150 RepID=S4P9C5_9NEOP